MPENKLAARIQRLETFAAKNPALYRFRVALLALLGYAYLLVVVLLLLAIVVALVFSVRLNFIVIKIVWIPLVLVGLVLRSLWITIPEPDGKELQQSEAPALFDLIGAVRTKLNGPGVHHVFVSDEFNASIVQIPRFGMFGWFQNYLVIGLPLLRGLSPAEFRAVLAHEFGHLSGKHGRFSGWIYRVRQTWVQILTSVHQERSYASFLFEPFLAWYAPFFNRYSFVLARVQEREADEYSVEVAGKDVAGLALTRLMTKERVLTENFWPGFFRGAREQSLAPKDPFTQMLNGLEESIGSAKAQKWFVEALRVPTGYEDTHPALAERLAAIGFERDSAELNALIEAVVRADELKESAASVYIRELPEDFLPRMNRLWRERIMQVWNNRHDEIKKAGVRRAELDEQAKTRVLTIEEQWERAKVASESEGSVAALPALQAILDECPDHIPANFAVGAILLEQGNPEGIAYLEKIMQPGMERAGDACELVSGFYLEQGDTQKAEEFRKRAEEHYQNLRRLQEQATRFSVKDRLAPHELEEPRIKEIQEQLRKVRGLAAAYLFRKLLDGPTPAVYVLAVNAEFTWRNGRSEKHIAALFDELAEKVDLPSPYVFLALDGPHAHLLPYISRIERAELFAAPDHGIKHLH
jgi:Zn-dependent protease with chaperone function